jgi:predicted dehydrogenase
MTDQKHPTRREFIETTAASGLALSAASSPLLAGPNTAGPNEKLNVALIGCGTQGLGKLKDWLRQPELQFIAVCDPNKESWDYPTWGEPQGQERGQHGGREVARARIEQYYAQQRGKSKYRGCAAYADFRDLLEKENDLDAVFIMTPDHLHATIAVAAMKQGVRVATHKPIGNYMHETRVACETARVTGVGTHCLFFRDGPKTYTMKQLVNRGVIGQVKAIHRWSNRPVWPQGMPHLPKEQPVPDNLDWQLWLGPSKPRPYAFEYTHTRFRSWYEFGGGILADMGYYGLWRDWRVLNLGIPVSAKADTSWNCEINHYKSFPVANEVSYPSASKIHFRVPVQDTSRTVDVFWYDGGMKPNPPQALIEQDEELKGEGVMFVGEKGIIYTSYNEYEDIRIMGLDNTFGPIPIEQVDENELSQRGVDDPQAVLDSLKVPASYLAKSQNEMIDALKGVRRSRGSIENARNIAETICLGNLAVRMSRPRVGSERLQWDTEQMRVTNVQEANKFLKRDARKSWELEMP